MGEVFNAGNADIDNINVVKAGDAAEATLEDMGSTAYTSAPRHGTDNAFGSCWNSFSSCEKIRTQKLTFPVLNDQNF